MATYTYSVPGVDLAKLQTECVAAGLPVDAVNGGAIGSPDVYVNTSRDLTPLEVASLDNVVATHDGRPRRPRPFLTLFDALTALTVTQRDAIGNDLFGPSNKWAADVTTNRGSLAVLWLLAQLNLTAVQTRAVKTAAAALYCQDFPSYLVAPSFAPTVNIPGDEPIPTA